MLINRAKLDYLDVEFLISVPIMTRRLIFLRKVDFFLVKATDGVGTVGFFVKQEIGKSADLRISFMKIR